MIVCIFYVFIKVLYNFEEIETLVSKTIFDSITTFILEFDTSCLRNPIVAVFAIITTIATFINIMDPEEIAYRLLIFQKIGAFTCYDVLYLVRTLEHARENPIAVSIIAGNKLLSIAKKIGEPVYTKIMELLEKFNADDIQKLSGFSRRQKIYEFLHVLCGLWFLILMLDFCVLIRSMQPPDVLIAYDSIPTCFFLAIYILQGLQTKRLNKKVAEIINATFRSSRIFDKELKSLIEHTFAHLKETIAESIALSLIYDDYINIRIYRKELGYYGIIKPQT